MSRRTLFSASTSLPAINGVGSACWGYPLAHHWIPKKRVYNDAGILSGTGFFVSYTQAVMATARSSRKDLNGKSREWQIDTSQLREIRILDKNVERLQQWCPTAKPRYMVVVKSFARLPSNAEVSINVTHTDELDELLAALTFLSPEAKIVGGTGM